MAKATDAPGSVSLVAMGASCASYIGLAAQHGGRPHHTDEVWAVNAMGGIIEHDRLFAMDHYGDLLRQRGEGVKVATGMLEWLGDHPGPVYMPEAVPDVPGSVTYPLQGVLDDIGFPYLNTTVAYALGLGIHIGVREFCLYGCDFTYPNQHRGESGRGCVEWIMGWAGARGIRFELGEGTTLMDGYMSMDERLYGYPEGWGVEQNEETGRWLVTRPEVEAPEPEPLGGGWYRLPSGEKVQGREAACRMMQPT